MFSPSSPKLMQEYKEEEKEEEEEEESHFIREIKLFHSVGFFLNAHTYTGPKYTYMHKQDLGICPVIRSPKQISIWCLAKWHLSSY